MRTLLRGCLVAVIVFLAGCGGKPAPVDGAIADKIATEMLACGAKKGYQTPFTPEQIIECLTVGFDKTGYSYSATLQKYADDGVSVGDPGKFKFAAFMIFPVQVLKPGESIDKYYSGNDLKAVKEIMRMIGIEPNSDISEKPPATGGYTYKP